MIINRASRDVRLELHTEPATFDEAVAVCRADGGEPLSVATEEDNQNGVIELLGRYSISRVWIGARFIPPKVRMFSFFVRLLGYLAHYVHVHVWLHNAFAFLFKTLLSPLRIRRQMATHDTHVVCG